MRRRPVLPLSFVLAFGCGGSGDAEDSGGPTGSTANSSSGVVDSSGSTTLGGSTGSADSGSTGGDNGLSHGVVQLELVRGESQAADPFVDTATVIAVLQYGECLVSFYADHPELQQDGAEGAAVFGDAAQGGEGWLDRLCAPTVAGQIACEVQAIVQDVATQRLTVVYSVSGSIEGGVLLFGPLPTATTAACTDGLLPNVRVSSSDAVTGNAENGTQLWGTESFSPPDAITNQGAPIRIAAAAVGG